MHLTISHRTVYSYNQPVDYALQRLRLWPVNNKSQTVRDWSLKLDGGNCEGRYVDGYGNETWLVSTRGGVSQLSITASGVIDTINTDGVVGMHRIFAPLWLFLQETPLTTSGPAIKALAAGIKGSNELENMHVLMDTIAEQVAYETGTTNATTTAEDALAGKCGVCQDHTHVFCAAARLMNIPARYVSGYLFIDDAQQQVASHAWAEAHIDGLGWVGFDCSNAICPDDRYVRIASGRDYLDASPTHGIRFGPAQETLEVHVNVEQ